MTASKRSLCYPFVALMDLFVAIFTGAQPAEEPLRAPRPF
jgi:hypothetical protein